MKNRGKIIGLGISVAVAAFITLLGIVFLTSGQSAQKLPADIIDVVEAEIETQE